MVESREDERRLISEELHDSTVQHLVSIDLALMLLRRRIGADETTDGLLHDIENSLDQATRELRTVTFLLHPCDLHERPLTAALESYCDGFSRRTNLPVQFRFESIIDRLQPDAQRALLRIVQEALANVYKHALASRVTVRCRCRGGLLHLVIADNGLTRKLRHSARARIGVGLSSMRSRLSQFGGSLKLTASRRGTIVRGILPADDLLFEATWPRTVGLPSRA